jgi:ADP-ribose pyrophosphatase
MDDSIQEWKELSREMAFQKYSRKIEKVMFQLPNGKESDFYIKKEGPAVAVLAITKNNEVVLVRQFRPGPKTILNELPGGYIDQKETPEEAGLRELKEETGYLGKAQLVTTALDCAYSTMERSCVVVTECDKVSEPTPDENEFVETILLSLEDFRALLKSGKMTDIEIGYIGLDFLGLL